jgi:prepilin-type N-terminal cleavage/methylation domain-containing protein
MCNKRNAFSLIELMVVIAIIAILAAVAVPSYISYINNAKISQGRMAIDNVADQVWLYYNVHGGFSNFVGVASLGLTPEPGAPYTTTAASQYAPYVESVFVNVYEQGYAGPNSCAYVNSGGGIYYENISNFGVGTDTITYYNNSFLVNGVVVRDCFFHDNNADPTFVIEGCYNQSNPAQAAAQGALESTYGFAC